jgi:hypothetical protein
VLDAEVSGTPSKLNYKKLMDISDCMLRNPSKSLPKLAKENDIGHSDFPNADLQNLLANTFKRVQASINARGHHFQHIL